LAASKSASDDDIVVTMDADETHTPGLILSMVRMIREGHDVVVASRYQRGSRVYGLGAHRILISWAASLLLRLLFPIRGIRDYTCGYRAYRGAAFKYAINEYGNDFVDQDGFHCMVDILLKLRSLPLVFGEVPLILRYDRKKGASKMRLLRTSIYTLRLLCIRRLGH
jgi:dolichol-phosphate mannosyltransferase